MTDSRKTSLDEPCDICGDIGVVDAIVTCSQCKIAREHLYCMKIYPKDFPEVWLCVACQQSNEIALPNSNVKEDVQNATQNEITHSTGIGKLTDGKGSRVCLKWEKRARTGKVKYLCAREAMMLASGTKKVESISKGDLCSSTLPSKTMVSISTRTPTKLKAKPPEFSIHTAKANTRCRPAGHLKHAGHGISLINPVVQLPVTQNSNKLKEKNAHENPMEDHSHKGEPIVACKPAEKIGTSVTKVEVEADKASHVSSQLIRLHISSRDNVSPNLESRNSDAENGYLTNILPIVEKKFPSHPALDASWKGGFKILGNIKHGELNDGLRAHPPTKVRRKVFEFSKQLPRILQFELLPRCNIWTDIFQNDCPDRDDIALYFFCCDNDRSESYIFLLEYLDMHDLVMRSNMESVELLVLTSKLLHSDSQRWNGKYFLWGVFHRLKKDETKGKKHEEQSLHVLPSHSYDSQTCGEQSEVADMEVDMEVDMIGGKDVGRVDVSIPKESLRRVCGSFSEKRTAVTLHGTDTKTIQLPSLEDQKELCYDIPPGFEQRHRPKILDSSSGDTVKLGKLVDGKKMVSPAKESALVERALEVSGASNSQRQKHIENSNLPGFPEKRHQLVYSHGSGMAMNFKRSDGERCIKTEKEVCMGTPVSKINCSRGPIFSKLMAWPEIHSSQLEHPPGKVKTEVP